MRAHREIRSKIRELEKVKLKDIEEYSEREDKIRKLLELLYCSRYLSR